MRILQLLVSLCSILQTCTFQCPSFFTMKHSTGTLSQLSCEPETPQQKKRFYDNDIDFASVLRKCKYSNDYQPAIELAERAMLLRPMPPTILTGVIKVFGEAGQLGRAVSLLRIMKEEMNVEPNGYHLGALIAACRRCGQWEMGVALYNRMDSLKVAKNTIICNSIISTLGDALQWQPVFDILLEMDKLGIKKDIVTYSSAITACVKAGEWEHAITLYRLMEKEGVNPNTITLNAVLSACARGRQVRLALDLFSEACKLGITVDTISYSVVIKVCGDINEFDIALSLFNAMGDDDSAVTIEPSATASGNELLPIWNSSSQSQFSREYIKEILSTCRPVPRDAGCYNSIITCCERAGKWKIAVDILNRMMRSSKGRIRPDSKTFSAAISCCGKAGQWNQALIIFNQMAAQGARKDTAVYNAMIAALQLAAQRRLSEEILASKNNGVCVQGVSSAELFESAQTIYAEGLADGQLQHLAYDSNVNKFNSRNVIEEGDGRESRMMSELFMALDTGNSRSISDSTAILHSATTAAPPSEVLEKTEGRNEVFLPPTPPTGRASPPSPGKGDRKETHLGYPKASNQHSQEHSQEYSPNSSGTPASTSTAARNTSSSSTSSSTSTSTTTTSSSSTTTSSSSPSAPIPMALVSGPVMTSPSSVTHGTAPRVLDLHGCPLLVAKAAIDYELKQIYLACQDIQEVEMEVMDASICASISNTCASDSSSDVTASTSSSSSSSIGNTSTNDYSNTRQGLLEGALEGVLENAEIKPRRSMRPSRRKNNRTAASPTTSSVPLSVPPSVLVLDPAPSAVSDTSLTPHKEDTPISQASFLPPTLASSKTLLPNPTLPPSSSPSLGGGDAYVCTFALHIITGRGRHVNSKGTRGVLKLEIKEYLLDAYGLVAERILGNDGCIIITGESLSAWVRKMNSL